MTYQPHQAEDLALKVALPEPFKVLLGPLPVFTAQQMREQWDAGRRAGLEEAAKLCETTEHGAFGNQTYLSGIRDGMMGCAAILRAKAALHKPCPRCIGTGQNIIHGGVCGACGGTGRAKP